MTQLEVWRRFLRVLEDLIHVHAVVCRGGQRCSRQVARVDWNAELLCEPLRGRSVDIEALDGPAATHRCPQLVSRARADREETAGRNKAFDQIEVSLTFGGHQYRAPSRDRHRLILRRIIVS